MPERASATLFRRVTMVAYQTYSATTTTPIAINTTRFIRKPSSPWLPFGGLA